MKETPHSLELSAQELSIRNRPGFSRLPLVAAGVGLLGVLISVLLGLGSKQLVWASYLISCLFFLSLGLGSLFFVLVQFASRAGWSVVVRRLAEHAMGTLPLVAILTVPLCLGLHELYPWSRGEVLAQDALLGHRAVYLNSSFFFLRSLIYLLSWTIIAWWFRSQSLRQDLSGGGGVTRRLQAASGPALVWFGLTVTFAAFDWIMSLDPHWYSTIFGVYFFSGCVVAGLAFLVLVIVVLQQQGFLIRAVTFEHLHDLGKLLFGFTVFWAYIAFSQFLLIWYANLPEETEWYACLLENGWEPVTVLLVLGHFVVPFFFLLPRDIKRRRSTLLAAAIWLLVMHYLDLYWLVMPNFHPGSLPGLGDLATLVAVGGLFTSWLSMLLRRGALVPMRDPRLQESLSFENLI
ncbi:MAG: hypothetical protein ACE5JX_09400 [Acidobacteriota bacterium]